MKPRTIQLSTINSIPTTIEIHLIEELFDQSADVTFFVKDIEGRYQVVNQSLVERHGLKDKSQVLGKTPRDICPGDIGRIPSEQDLNVLRTGTPLVNHLELHWYGPHQPGWCLTTKLPMKDKAGKIIGIVGISRDVRVPIERAEIPPDFAAAVEAFEKNVSEPMTPAILAQRSRLTAPRLARLTKRLFGLTPSHFITKTRLTVAATLLRDTSLSIAQVAVACGFFDHSAFTRAFRAATGVTPSEFRER